MCKLFDKNQVYNVRAISEIYFDAYPNQYSSIESCVSSVSNRATRLESEGVIKCINDQKRNRVYSGLHAEIICDSLKASVNVGSKSEKLSLYSGLSESFFDGINEDIEFSGWLGNVKGKRSNAEILITKQTSNGKDRLNIRFNSQSYTKIFGNSRKVSVYVSKKSSNLFIIPQAINGVPSWTISTQGQNRKFAIQIEDSYKSFLLKFIGEYSLGELVQTGLSTPDGTSVKAWGFKAKDQ